MDPQGLHPVLARMQGLYYRYGPAITEFIAGASGVNGALASPAVINPLVAQIPTGVSRMLPIARGISEGVESGAFFLLFSGCFKCCKYSTLGKATHQRVS